MNKKDFTPLLSVVIISKNEEENIEKCLSSVINATKDIPREIILVDGNSTDNTLKIANKFDIKIVEEIEPYSPSSGRYIGYMISNKESKYVFFSDGDMILNKIWLKEAIDIIENDEKIGIVSGHIVPLMDNIIL